MHQRDGLRTLDDSHRTECLRWTQTRQADLGGTEMHGALASLFEIGGEGGRDADVFLITDGEVWNTEEIITLSRTCDQPAFVIAIGSSTAAKELAGTACKGDGRRDGDRDAEGNVRARPFGPQLSTSPPA